MTVPIIITPGEAGTVAEFPLEDQTSSSPGKQYHTGHTGPFQPWAVGSAKEVDSQGKLGPICGVFPLAGRAPGGGVSGLCEHG